MIRMEMACFFVVAFMAIVYFSAKRERTRLHKIFSTFLLLSMVHLLLDAATIYTVNRLEEIPGWVNDILHRLFIGTMVILFCLVYRYIILLVKEEVNQTQRLSGFSFGILGVTLIGAIFLPIEYEVMERGNYATGPVAYMAYASIAVYLIGAIIVLSIYWKQVHPKKKIAITTALAIEIGISLYQAVSPLALLSGMGIMLIALSFYLTMENPDIVLVEQIREEKRKAEEANDAKSVFLSNMSHEIRTPMNAIVGMTEIMLRTELDVKQKEYLHSIKSSGNALIAIVNDILDISKIEAGKMELIDATYDIYAIFNDLQKIIENRIGEKPIELQYDIDKELPRYLYGDGLRIRQVIINLLSNAVKFTEEGYVKLTVYVEDRTADKLIMAIAVEDTGQGIKEEDMPKLFDAFEQVDVMKNRGKGGTGLGLSISSQLIVMMGGKLEVCSVYGAGSKFFFSIPQGIVSDAEEKMEEEQEENLHFIAPEAKILIADDNIINRKVAVQLLEPLQMQISTADNGQKALEMIQQNEYHMVLMDHMMPVLDGVEATRRLRALDGEYYQKLPVIALTANAMKEAEKQFYEVGMNGFIAKPIDLQHMYRLIYKWLPEELIIRQQKPKKEKVETEKVVTAFNFEPADIDIAEGIKNTGSPKFFESLLGDFYQMIDSKSLKIEKCLADNMIRDYTIEVHALKNTARMIGAMQLSQEFLRLEELGNAEDRETLLKETPDVLAHYRKYKEILKPYGDSKEKDKKEVSKQEIILYLKRIHDKIEGFDLDAADVAMDKLEECKLPSSCQKHMEELRVYMADVAMEEILDTTKKLIDLVQQEL
ncbi:MAG: response regulator [Lachnospiraceae bacterium]|nr:response regulator [Lachnospiraceae bacterium]